MLSFSRILKDYFTICSSQNDDFSETNTVTKSAISDTLPNLLIAILSVRYFCTCSGLLEEASSQYPPEVNIAPGRIDVSITLFSQTNLPRDLIYAFKAAFAAQYIGGP